MTARSRVVAQPGCFFFAQANDICIGYLDADVPSTIKHYPVLPADYGSYLGTWIHPNRPLIPFMVCDQEEKALIGSLPNVSSPTCFELTKGITPAFGTSGKYWDNYWEGVVIGDSGHPSFLVFEEDEVVLVETHTRGSAAGITGPSYAHAIVEINAVMAALDLDGTGYQLELFDFSAFEDAVTSSESSSLSSLSSSSSSSLSSLSSSSVSSEPSLEEPAGASVAAVGPAGKSVAVPV